MVREFRAWDTINDDFMHNLLKLKDESLGYPYEKEESWCYWGTQLANFWDWDGKLIWEQFTGLLDMNGKKIFEGDSIRAVYGIPGRVIETDVEYEGSAFIVKTPGHNPESCTLFKFIEYVGEVEVIGNIHIRK
jgi:uncharacterized phage protein (TIGR01671 family)